MGVKTDRRPGPNCRGVIAAQPMNGKPVALSRESEYSGRLDTVGRHAFWRWLTLISGTTADSSSRLQPSMAAERSQFFFSHAAI